VLTSSIQSGADAVVGFGSEALGWLNQEQTPENAYWRMFLDETPEVLAPNLRARVGVVRRGNRLWPLSVHEVGGDLSYPCSLLTQYVRYPLAELALLRSAGARTGAWMGLQGLGAFLRLGAADRVVQWSSGLLSTNLHGDGLIEDAPEVTQALAHAFPRHAILIKNIHGYASSPLPGALASLGYDLITSRQIYFFDGKRADFLSRSDVKKDLKALRELEGYSIVNHDGFNEGDIPRITQLYANLYLLKHSRLNPQYSEVFVARAWRERLLEFKGLRGPSGKIDAVYACYRSGEVTSTPFIGYDTELSAKTGFYRLLVAMLLRDVAEAKILLNYSSGAGEFKRRRGAEPALEWNALYTKHLSARRQSTYKILGWLLNGIGRRFLEENKV